MMPGEKQDAIEALKWDMFPSNIESAGGYADSLDGWGYSDVGFCLRWLYVVLKAVTIPRIRSSHPRIKRGTSHNFKIQIAEEV